VTLRRQPDGALLLEIDDDGRGFDGSVPSTGMGLANLEARVSSMGGDFEAVSVLGDGTTVTARWPA
jgi:signal transduction histidine kinase